LAAARGALAQGAAAGATPPTANPAADDWWTTYKGDPQRTNARSVRLGLPLNLLWRHSTDSAPGQFTTSPLVAGTAEARRIFFCTGEFMYCVEGSTGEQVWQSEMTEGYVSTPLTMMRGANDDLIIAVTNRNRVIAVNASNGTQAWQYTARAQRRAGVPAVIPTPRGERLVIAIGDGRIVALTPQGELDPDWSVRLGRRISDPSSTPALTADNKRLIITARDRNVYAYNLNTNAMSYTIELEKSAELSPVIVQSQIVLISNTTMSGHDVNVGKRLWSVDLRDTVDASPAAMVRSGRPIIYVGSRNGTLSAIDGTTGKVLWSTNVEASITTSPTVASDVILVGTSTGLLVGVNPENGTVVWQYRLHSERTTIESNEGGEGEGEGEGQGGDQGGDQGGGEAAAVPFIQGNAQFGPGVGVTPGGANPGFTPGGAQPEAPATPAPTLVTETYGISATPVVAGGKLYVLGDNAALYAFDSTILDVLPPRAVAPSLSVTNSLGQLSPTLVEGNRPPAVPGQAPIYFALELADTGSGVNAATIQVTLNKKPVPSQNLYFQRSSGVLTVTVAEKVPLNKGNLPDGQYTLNVIARDYRDNEMNYSASFVVDNSLPAPAAAQPAPAPPVAGAPLIPGTFGGMGGAAGTGFGAG
jgi:outer membrane protein assembly factor BamB